MSRKFKLTSESITLSWGTKVFRIKALRAGPWGAKGTLGGFVQREDNLSQDGDCWVSDSAVVSGNARVSDSAVVSGNALVYGNEVCSGTPQYIDLALPGCHSVVVGDKFVTIGCEQHTLAHWLKHYKDIGKANGYTPKQVEAYKRLLNLIKTTQALRS